jgi:hypothetical protein
MKGNVVTAAKVVGISLILSAIILVFGIALAVGLHRASLAEKPTETTRSAQPTPNDRMAELLIESENLRQIDAEKRRFWLLSHPSPLTYERVSGAMEP